MSIIAVHSFNPRNGGVSVAAYLGRFTSSWLNRRDGSSLTATDTALDLTSNITIECFINGASIGTKTVSNILTDSSRGFRTFEADGLPPGDHACRITTDSHDSIENDITFTIRIWQTSQAKIVGTSCMRPDLIDNNQADYQDVDVGTGDPDDNYPDVLGGEPLNGEFANISKLMAAESADIWMHPDDWVYILEDARPDWGAPASLTDTGTDVPALIPSITDYTENIVNISTSRTASIANQALYYFYENQIRRPDVQRVCRAGAALARQHGDHTHLNDFDHSWWRTIRITDGSSQDADARLDTGGTQPANNPFQTAAYNPEGDPNHLALMKITAIFWKVTLDAYKLYVDDFNPPKVPGLVSEVPNVVSTAGMTEGVDYFDEDYVPLTWQLDHPVHSIISSDFTTCTDLIPIASNDFLALNVAEDAFLGNGTPRTLHHPLGSVGTHETLFASAIIAIQDKGRHVIFATPKEIGSQGSGNIDAIFVRAPAWVRGLLNTFFPSLDRPIVSISGDWHRPTAWRTDS